MTATEVKVEMALEEMTIAGLVELGKEMGLTFPSKTRKAEIISGILAKREEIEAEKQREEEEDQRIQATIEEDQRLQREREAEEDNAPANLAALKDHPANVVSPPPLGVNSGKKKGINLTPEEIQSRIESSRKESEEAETLRKAAEASKAKYVSWEPTTEELIKRYGKIGYAVGLVIQAAHRLQKELKVSEDVIDGMGEDFNIDAAHMAKAAAVEGYAKAWDTYKFPSKAIRGLRGEALASGIWKEIEATQPDLPLFAYLANLPQMEEEEIEEEDEGELEEEGE